MKRPASASRAFRVTPTQLGALNRLIQEPGLSGTELARRLLVTPQAEDGFHSVLGPAERKTLVDLLRRLAQQDTAS